MVDEDGHAEEQRRCFEELALVLGDLANEHPTLVVVAALSEELGLALLGCQESGACNAAQVHEILGRMEALVFADDVPQPALSP
jgi:hypothetical protein